MFIFYIKSKYPDSSFSGLLWLKMAKITIQMVPTIFELKMVNNIRLSSFPSCLGFN